MRMKERLYVSDNGIAVSEEDRRGRQLLCKKGSFLDDAIAKKYSLVDGGLPLSKVQKVQTEKKVPLKRKKKKQSENLEIMGGFKNEDN